MKWKNVILKAGDMEKRMKKTPSGIINIFSLLEKAFRRITDSLAILCGVLLFLFMFMVIADVSGRYLISKPVASTEQVGQIVLGFATFLALASVLLRGQFIRVTLLEDRLSPNAWAWLDILALAAGFFLASITAWGALPFAISSYQVKETDILYHVPFYHCKFAFFVGYLFLCIGFFILLARRVHTKMTNRTRAKENTQP